MHARDETNNLYNFLKFLDKKIVTYCEGVCVVVTNALLHYQSLSKFQCADMEYQLPTVAEKRWRKGD